MRWILCPLVLMGCKGGKDDSTGGSDDTGGPDTGATHVTASTVGTMDGGDVDAIEMIHVVGGAFAELTNVPEFNEIVEGTLDLKIAPPPPIGELSCIHRETISTTEVDIDFSSCTDDRSGAIHLEGQAPTTATFEDFTVFGYTLSGTMTWMVATPNDGRFQFEVPKGDLTVAGKGRSVEISAAGKTLADYLGLDDDLMSLDADMTVIEGGDARAFLVGNGAEALSLQPAFPLTWSIVASTPRRPINGTISFQATSGTYTASITAETLQSEIGIPKDSVPLAGIPDLPIAMEAQPIIGVSYGKETTAIGIQTEEDSYPGTVQKSDILAIAQDCALSQADCDALAQGIDDKLADEVTVSVDWLTIVSAFSVAYEANFDDSLAPTK
jgi:hypothetical protein